MKPKRVLLFAALALAVPLPALALEGGSGGSALGVQASLNGCGVSGASIACRINAGFTPLSEAEYYTASVSGADGSVTDFGTVASGGGGSAELVVPYTGNGSYTVTVTAWGYDEQGKPDVVSSDESGASGKAKREGHTEAIANPPPGADTGVVPPPDEQPEQPPECPQDEELQTEGAGGDPSAETAQEPVPAPAGAPDEQEPDPCREPEEDEEEAVPPPPAP
jgi:hypothetical protein